jgi:peroxin-6
LVSVAHSLPSNATGADIGALTTKAFSVALERQLKRLEDDALSHVNVTSMTMEQRNLVIASYVNRVEEEVLQVKVTEQDFIQATVDFVPSISAVDLERYERLRTQYE